MQVDLSNLSSRQRQVVERRLKGHSFRKIAGDLEINHKVAQTYLKRALPKLSEEVKKKLFLDLGERKYISTAKRRPRIKAIFFKELKEAAFLRGAIAATSRKVKVVESAVRVQLAKAGVNVKEVLRKKELETAARIIATMDLHYSEASNTLGMSNTALYAWRTAVKAGKYNKELQKMERIRQLKALNERLKTKME